MPAGCARRSKPTVSRVQMAAGNMADGVSHGQHGQAEGQCHPRSYSDIGNAGSQQCAAATAEEAHPRFDEFAAARLAIVMVSPLF